MSEIRARSFVSAQMVADLAGVSRSAVSRTFTDGASVSDATRRKVLSAANVLGYHVNHLARGLIQDRSNIVCLVVSDLTTPFRARMLEILTSRLQSIDKVAMVINTGGDSESVSAALQQALRFRADATVVLSGTPAASLVETCIASGQRVVLINRDTAECLGEVRAIVGQHGRPGPDLWEAGWCLCVDPEAVVEAPASQFRSDTPKLGRLL